MAKEEIKTGLTKIIAGDAGKLTFEQAIKELTGIVGKPVAVGANHEVIFKGSFQLGPRLLQGLAVLKIIADIKSAGRTEILFCKRRVAVMMAFFCKYAHLKQHPQEPVYGSGSKSEPAGNNSG